LLGTYARSSTLLIIAAVGVVLAAWYTLRLYQGTMNGEPQPDAGTAEIGAVETGVLAPLAAMAVLIGVFPEPFLSFITGSVGGVVKLLVGG
jgi:NADH-quinone oxidoreductase subunit M